MASDGSYTYTVSNSDVRVQHLSDGETLTDSFVYTIKDSDGDTSTTTLTMTIKGTSDTPSITPIDGNNTGNGTHTGGEATVYEAGLASGSAHDGTNITTGTIDISAKDGLTNVIIGNGVNAVTITEAQLLGASPTSPVSITTADGSTLKVTGFAPSDSTHQDGSGTISYTYTLNTTQASGTVAGNNDITDSINLTVTERNNVTSTGTLHVTIVDDVPTANPEATITVSEGVVAATGMVNLLANDVQGADGATVSSFNFDGSSHAVSGSGFTTVTSTTNGTLSVKADGTWTYTSPQSVNNVSGDVTKSFTYTITDKDGDTSTATQNISVTDGANPTIAPDSQTISEASLGSGATLTPTDVTASLHVVQGADTIASTKFTTLQSDLTSLGITSDGHALSYTVASDGSSIIATRAGDNAEVFRITLTGSGATGGYDFKLSLPIDHIKNADPLLDHDLKWDIPLSVTTTDSDGSTVSGSFIVSILDSIPSASDINVTLAEDNTGTIIRLGSDAFLNGDVTINGSVIANGNSANVYDPNATSTVVGHVVNNGNGTVTFTPIADYSNYNAKPTFSYTVTDRDGDTASANVILTITPVADAPTMQADQMVTTYEDSSWNGTSYTGDITKAIGLGLTLPTRNDQTDINTGSTGDAPERVGVLTLSFTGSADFGTATIGYDTNGDGTLDGILTTITKSSSFTIDITDVANYHPTGTSGTYHLTQAQYDSLAIIPAENNATNIKMTVKTASHEVTDSGALLSTDIVSATQTQNVTLDVKAVTDPITLSFDTSTGGTLSAHPNSNDTYTATASIAEGIHVIDLQALLTNTSGTSLLHGDLDGSELRSYTISGIPEGTIINLGGTTATANASGIATVSFSSTSNTQADPIFTMTPPEHFSGQIDATITLSVHDTDSDSTVTPATNTQIVYFHQEITPVAGPVTLHVAQAKGYEDAGRSAGNTANDASAAVINHPENGIPLHINVTSADTDGSETYTVEISAIPAGATLYYNGLEVTQSPTGTISIANFNNSTPLTIVPPLNSDVDFILQVKAHSVDFNGISSSTGADSVSLSLNVQVIGVADVPVNDSLATVTVNDDTSVARTFNLVTTEDHSVNLKDVLATPSTLSSYDSDGSEALSIKVTGLAAGFDISGATFLGGSGTSRIWYVDVADLKAGNVILSAPTNYAGEVDFKMSMITTEREGNSKTSPDQNVSIMITPVVDASINNHSTQNEDQILTLDFGLNKPDSDTVATSGVEKLTSFAIDMSSVPSGVVLTGSSSGVLSGSGYVTLHVDSNGVLETVTATLPANSNMNGNYSFGIQYSIADTTQDSNSHSYTTVKDTTDTYIVTVNAVTDIDTSLNINNTSVTGTITTDSSHTVSVTNNGTFTQTLDLHAPSDIDGSESLTRIEISGVPQGVSVVGGHYAGNIDGITNIGVWYVDVNPDEVISSADTLHNLVFNVDGTPIIGNYAITVTAFNQDIGSSEHANTTTFNLDIASSAQFTNQTSGIPATINSFYQDIDSNNINDTANPSNNVYQNSILREDTLFALGSVVDVNTTNIGDFAITLKNVPTGVLIEGMTSSNGFYTIQSSGDSTAVLAALNSIHITPALNSSTDANSISSTDLKFDVELTTYAAGGAQNTSLVHFTGSVLPVTDHMDFTTVNDGTTTEDTAQAFSVKLDNAADGTNTVIVGGNAYVQLHENYTDAQGANGTSGTLTVAGHTMTLQTLDLGNGSQSYYVIAGVIKDETLNFSYEPASNRDGNVSVDVSVQNQEASNWNGYSTATLLSTKTVTFSVTPIQDGFTFDTTTTPSVGTEDYMTQLHVAVTNPDSSEKLLAVSLNNVPNNFLVYYGADAAHVTLANNVGANGMTTIVQMTYGVDATVVANLWNIPLTGGALPAYIGIAAPINWSGTLSNLSFDVIDNSGETQSSAFAVTVNAVADGMSINPTVAFNSAYSWTNINLNASMVDLDGSESMTLQLSAKSGSTALDSTAIFRLVDGTAIDSSHAVFDSSTHTWTLSGIASSDINNLQMLYHDYTGTVQATAQTVEASDTSHPSSTITGEFPLSLTATTSIDLHTETRDLNIVTTDIATTVLGGSGNDTIHTGIGNNVIDGGGGADTITAGAGNDTITTDGLDTIDGGAGLDTIKLVSGITLDFSKLHNIETIDLTANGAHTISNLKLSDVFNITDSNHILEIKGDGTDSVNAVDKTGWTKTSGVDNGTSTTYIYHDSSSNSITLKVDDNINHTAL